MNYADARVIYDNEERRKDWLTLDEQVRIDLFDLMEWYDARQSCCMPYDCMCHEQCSWEDTSEAKCGGCQQGARLHESTIKVSGDQYEFALASREIGDHESRLWDLQTIKMLEESGDYVGAARMFYGEDQ